MDLPALSLLLPSAPVLAAFMLAAAVLALTPGPGVFYIVARTLSQGRASGLASVAGVALGNLGNAAAAAIGLAALLSASAAAFHVLRLAGAAYLVWLGVQMLRRRPAAAAAPVTSSGHGQVLRQGLVVALLNPKTTLFFAAFLPQFMAAPVAPALQALLLGAVFVLIAAVTDTAYVLLASALAPRLANATRGARSVHMLAGAVTIGLGIWAALAGTRPAQPR